MKLADYQRAVRELSFSAQVAPRDQQALPDFLLYREMIRSRFVSMAELAFRRSWLLLGSAACAQSFARYLERRSPSSPILREVIAGFGDFALCDRELLEHAALPAVDLLRFELATWRAASEHAALPASWLVRELDFDGVLVTNKTLQLLRLDYDVCEHAEPAMARDPHALLVYRRAGDDAVHWYRAPVLLSQLLELAELAEQTVAQLVLALFASTGVSEERLEELAGALTIAVERGVLLGVRDAS